MAYSEKAAELHHSGCNCCQAVLCACCEHFDMDQETAYRLGAFFGGGMRRGEVCGAVSAALMILGLQYGDENNRTCTKSTEFLRSFQEKYGSIRCRELLGAEGRSKKDTCPLLIEYCTNYLEKELSE